MSQHSLRTNYRMENQAHDILIEARQNAALIVNILYCGLECVDPNKLELKECT